MKLRITSKPTHLPNTAAHVLRWGSAMVLFGLATPIAFAGCGDDEDGTSKPKPPTPAERMCGLIKDAVEGCASATPCDQALVEDCADVAGILSDPLLTAAADCIEGGGSPGSCLASATGSITATDAHRAFAAQFCSECAFGVPGCEDAFFSGTGDTQIAGLIVLPFGDEVVNQITSECASGLTCATTIVSCAQGVLAQQAIPDATIQCALGQLTGGLIGDDGDGGMPGMSDTGGDCTVDDGTGTGTETGIGTGQCGTYVTGTGDPTCQSCFETECCSQLQGCSAGTPCATLISCYGSCAEADSACFDGCEAANPSGVAAYNSLYACTTLSCKDSCPFGPSCGTGFLSIGDGGACDQCIEASCCSQLDACIADGITGCVDCLTDLNATCTPGGTALLTCLNTNCDVCFE